MDGRIADYEVAGRGLHQRLRAHHARLQGGGDGERLEGRSRLEQIGHRAIASSAHVELRPVVRVVCRHVGHRQHLAGAHVDGNDPAGLGPMLDDRGLQLAIGEVLQLAIDRQREVAALDWRAHALRVLHHPPQPVLDDPAAAGLPGQPVLVGELDSLLAAVVHIGEAEQMRSHFAVRVVAAVLTLERNTRKAKLHDLGRGVGRQVALQVDELAILLGEAASDLTLVHAEQSSELAALAGAQGRIDRAGPDRLDRGGHRERLAVAVGDHAAVSGQLEDAGIARLALLLQEVVVQHLQIEGARRATPGRRP